MSCNCNNIPCCCRDVNYPTTTTTLCPDGEKCEVTVTSDCVIHDGNCLQDCFDIVAGNTLTDIIGIIMEQFPECTTTTTIMGG